MLAWGNPTRTLINTAPAQRSPWAHAFLCQISEHTLQRAHTCTHTHKPRRHAGACCAHTHTQHTLVGTAWPHTHTHARAHTERQPSLSADGVREGEGQDPLWGIPPPLQFCCLWAPFSQGVPGAATPAVALTHCRTLWARRGHGSRHPTVWGQHTSHPSAEAGALCQTGEGTNGTDRAFQSEGSSRTTGPFCPISLPWRLSHWSRREVEASLRMWPKVATVSGSNKRGSACCWKTSA